MTNYSRTTLRELKKRYLNILKKCLLANLMAFSMVILSTPATADEDRLENSGEKTYTQGVTFKDLEYVVSVGNSHGGAIYNSGTITFDALATFEGNSAIATGGDSYGGAIRSNAGSVVFEDTDNNTEPPVGPNITYGITFNGDTLFTGNKAESETGNSYGGAIWNNGYMLLAGENTFGGYKVDSEGNKISLGNEAKAGGAIYNSSGKKEGDVIAYGMTLGKSTFMGNTALSYGGAIANTGYMNFTDEALFEGNKASSQGGAIYNTVYMNFTEYVEFLNNRSEKSNAGAIFNTGTINFNTDAKFKGNYAKGVGGGISNTGKVTFNSTDENDQIIFEANNSDSNGGALYQQTEFSNMIFNPKVEFLNNTAVTAGAIYNSSGSLSFNNGVLFQGNEATTHYGAVVNTGNVVTANYVPTSVVAGKITFNGPTTFKRNIAVSVGGGIGNMGSIVFGENATAIFEGNESRQHSSAIYNYKTTLGYVNSEQKWVIYQKDGQDYYQHGTIVFEAPVTFKNNKTEHPTGAVSAGAIYNTSGTIKDDGTMDIVGLTFKEKTVFENNKSISKSSAAYGSAISNSGVIKFEGDVEFKNNLTEGYKGVNATVLNQKRMDFLGDVIFSGNKTKSENEYAHGGALTNSGIIVFNGHTVFENNSAELKNGGAQGGAIRNGETGTLTFNSSFEFSGNKEISRGIEKKNDIHNVQGGIINFAHGVDENNNPLIGSLDGGISNHGTINKTGAGTLILGDNMVNTGTFNQSAGLTIAHADHFLTGTNNITGGELRVHGANMDKLKATVGENALLTFLSTSTSEIEMKLGENVSVAGDVKFGADESVGTAKYHLNKDVTAKTITIQDSILTIENNAFNGTYEMGENVTLNMQDGDTADSVSFANLTGSANLKIDADIVNGANGLELVTDQIATNQEATLNLKLTDVLLSAEALDNGINESYTATVMKGGTLTYGSEKGLVATDIYSYEVSGANNKITIDAVKFNEDEDSDVMKSVAEFDGDAAFNMTIGGDSYEMESDVVMTENTKSIVGKDKETSTLTAKKITVDGAILNVENVSVSGENQLIDVESGTLNVTTAKVDNIKNAGEATLDTAEVSEVENSGTLTANGSTIGALVNEKEAIITGGELETATNKEKGMLSLSVGLRAGTVTNEGELTLDAVTVADLTNSERVKVNGSTVQKLVNEHEAELTASTVEDLTNMGKMTSKDLTLKGALKGTGTATLSGKLVADNTFKSENKIISDGMEVSENIQKMELADLEIKEGTTLDIGTREVTAKDVKVGKEATLQVTLNGLDEFGTMAADKIEAGAGAGVHLVLGEKFEGGVFDVFKGTKGAGDLEVKHNNLYNVIEVEEGKYSFMTKDTEALQESLGATKEEVSVADAMTKGTSTNEAFNKMQSEMLIALQSLETDTVAKAKKALSAVGAKEQPIEQSVASEHLVALQNVVQAELHGSTVGHSCGDTDPRAKVYIKGLYDKTKSTMGAGFKARSKGAVLGVQSEVTEDLTLGVGYATSQTTAKEDLRRTEVDTNTGFISAQYQPNNWWVSGVVSYSRSQYDEEKHVLSSTGKANYDVDSWGAQVMTGYDIKLETAVITPEVGLRYLSVKQDGYTDTLGTTVSGTRSDYLTALVGVKGTWDMGAIRPTAGVTVGYDVISDDVSALNTLANGASYTVNGEALDRLSTTVTTGIEADLGDRTTLKLEYSGTFRKEYVDHSGMLKLEVKF